MGYTPLRCRVLLDLNHAANAAGDIDVMKDSLDELEHLVWENFFGYCPHYFIAHARCVASYGEGDVRAQVEDLLDRALRVSEEPVSGLITQLGAQLKQRLAEKSSR